MSTGGNGDRELIHTISVMIATFFANVILMNYLIAILSQTYVDMREKGIF